MLGEQIIGETRMRLSRDDVEKYRNGLQVRMNGE
jgi:hypothetical protein